MHLYYAIGFSGIGALLMVRFYNGGETLYMILGVLCLILGSLNGKKWQENRENK